MSQHHFDTVIAKHVGIVAATLLDNIMFWCLNAKANRRNEHEGLYWTYNSVAAFGEQFDYLTPKQIRLGLEKLEEFGLVRTGEFNKDKRDRTKWYTVTPAEHLPSWATHICPQGQLSSAREGKPLPDTTLPDTTSDHSRAERDVFDFYNQKAIDTGWIQHAKLTEAIRKNLGARIKEFGAEAVKQFIAALTSQEWTYRGFKNSPDFRVSLVYICRPRTFAEHFDKLVTAAPKADLLNTPPAEEPEFGSLEYHFAYWAKHKRWRGRADSFLLEPNDPDAKYPAALYAKYGLKAPEGVR